MIDILAASGKPSGRPTKKKVIPLKLDLGKVLQVSRILVEEVGIPFIAMIIAVLITYDN